MAKYIIYGNKYITYGTDFVVDGIKIPTVNDYLLYLQFENNLVDSGPNGYDFVAASGTPTYDAGVKDQAILITYSPSIILENYEQNVINTIAAGGVSSFSLWMKIQNALSSNESFRFAAVRQNTTEIAGLGLQLQPQARLIAWSGSTGNTLSIQTIDFLAWRHVVVNLGDATTDNNAYFWIDAVYVGFIPFNPGARNGSGNTFYIRRSGDGLASYIDNYRVYNRQLSQDQIEYIYNQGI
jgi:hypothetical protein